MPAGSAAAIPLRCFVSLVAVSAIDPAPSFTVTRCLCPDFLFRVALFAGECDVVESAVAGSSCFVSWGISCSDLLKYDGIL